MSTEEGRKIKQVIVYRRDLKMRKGKIAAQVAHASMAVFFNRGSVVRDHLDRIDLPSPVLMVGLTEDMAAWVEGKFTKIVLSVETEADLLRVHDLALEAGLPAALITDLGATEFHGVPTRTAVAVGPAPAPDIDPITGRDGLVTCKLA